MNNRLRINKKQLKIAGIVILILTLPLTLILVKSAQDTRSSAAAPDKLEAEAGVLTSTGVSKQNDTGASGGEYIRFTNQTNTLTPTPTFQPSTSTTYWVSPTGSDSNPGTQSSPWKTVAYTASQLKTGQTAIFRDGVYNETKATTFTENGTVNSPITMRAENPRQATIMYSANHTEKDKLDIRKRFITIDGFVVTQQTKGITTGDVLIRCYGQQIELEGDNCNILNNELKNAAIGIKFNSDHSLAKGNLIINMSRTGIDIFNGIEDQVIGNEIANTNPVNYGIYDKGGSRNTLFDSNFVHSTSTMFAGMMLGGGSGYQWIYIPPSTTPSEAFNSVAINNVVISENIGVIRAAYGFHGCNTCSFSNNVSIGTKYALSITNGGDSDNSSGGGAWTAVNHNPSFINNIAMNCEHRAVQFDNAVTGTLTFDYNLMYSCTGVAGPAQPSSLNQPHERSGDPLFVNSAGFDFHLLPSSPAIGTGLTLPAHPTYSDVNTPNSPPTPRDKDKSGVIRAIPWNLGIY